jgi:hypothetical protein
MKLFLPLRLERPRRFPQGLATLNGAWVHAKDPSHLGNAQSLFD